VLDALLRCAVGGIGYPALGAPRLGVGEVVGVAEETVVDDADLGAFWDVLVVDCDAAWLYVSR